MFSMESLKIKVKNIETGLTMRKYMKQVWEDKSELCAYFTVSLVVATVGTLCGWGMITILSKFFIPISSEECLVHSLGMVILICCSFMRFIFIIGYKMNKKIEREEMYILSEEEMLSFIKEDEEETLRNEIIDQFQKIIKTKGCVNYRDLLKVNKNMEIKRSNLLSIKNNQKQEKASICFGEKMRKELKIEEKLKDCV